MVNSFQYIIDIELALTAPCFGTLLPNVRLNCAAGGRVKRYGWRHATRMKNAPGLRPRQRRQLQGVLGGGTVLPEK